MKEFIKYMLEYALDKNGLDYNSMVYYSQLYAGDRRYKPFILASTTSGRSGILKYKGIKYHWYKDNNGLSVEVVA